MSYARDIKGPWLDAGVLQRTPHLHRQFNLNRDPYVARQLLDLEKTEKERREESTDRGHGPPRRDKPEPTLKPPRRQRGDADREGWLAAQRDAAFAQAADPDARREVAPEQDRIPTKDHTVPSL